MNEISSLQELRIRLQEVQDLKAATSVLRWDESTYMPPGGSAARGRQLATLGRVAHEKFTDLAIGKLLDAIEPHIATLPPDADDACLVRVTRRDYEHALKVPAAFLSRFYTHTSDTYHVWATARPQNDFRKVQAPLERTLDLTRELADFFPGYEHIADPLIDFADYGMKVSSLKPLLAQLREALVPLVEAVTAQEPADDACLKQPYPEEQQLAFGLSIITQFGYDLKRGRQDKTLHPFATSFSVNDVRITTRVKEHDLTEALFSTLHESGHAMYEQGINPALDGTPLADGTSSGVHESQSRLWENLVGRSRGFWEHYYPRLQDTFPEQLGTTPLDTFYRAINKVTRSLIRTDADELTYNLHVIIRFELELDLLEGKLMMAELPDAWTAKYQHYLGISPEDHTNGVLQDVHWFAGTIGGAFQGYTLGNILSAQFFEAATRAHPEIPQQITRGEFSTLHGWLRENIYRHGRKFTANEIIERATGRSLSIEPYVAYLKEKYAGLYALS